MAVFQRLRLSGQRSIFDRFAGWVARATGTPWAFAIAFATIVVWAGVGPAFRFSDSWQMVVNTGTTIATFLMVFLIQQSQNKDSLALHIKLNELLAAHEFASNRVVAIEDTDEGDLETLRSFYCELSKMAEAQGASRNRIPSTTLNKLTRASSCLRRGVVKRPRMLDSDPR